MIHVRRVDIPTPGFYLTRLVRNGPYVGASITLHDDATWSVMRDGIVEGPHEHPWELPLMSSVAFSEFSTADEVSYRIGLKRYEELYRPDGNAANPRRPINKDRSVPF